MKWPRRPTTLLLGTRSKIIKIKFNQGILKNLEMMIAPPFSSYIEGVDYFKTIVYTKVSLALIKRLKWDTTFKTIDYGCAYACAPHLVPLN